MKKFLLRLLLGGEELAERMIALVELRAQAVARHTENKRLTQELNDGEAELDHLKESYQTNREALELENAYRLELN
jgi:hypothetical protein